MGGCTSLGWMYENGRGVPQDTSHAVALYRQACAQGLGSACAEADRLESGSSSGRTEEPIDSRPGGER